MTEQEEQEQENYSLRQKRAIKALKYADGMTDEFLDTEKYRELRKQDRSLPSLNLMRKSFDTWNDAKKAASIERKTNYGQPLREKSDVVEALQEINERIDEPLTFKAFNKYRHEFQPSSQSIRDRFGTFNKAKRAAGLETWKPGWQGVNERKEAET